MPEYEVEFIPLGCNRSSRFHAVETFKEAEEYVQRMIKAEQAIRNAPKKDLPEPRSDMEGWFRILSMREPATGYRYTIREIVRNVVKEDEVMF